MTPWDRAALACDLLCTAGPDLGGLWLRARPGPARDAALARLAPLALRRCPPDPTDAALFGGIDVAEALATGRLVARPGLLDTAPALLLPMAERASTGLAGRLAAARDGGGPLLVALDEGTEEEAPPAPLTERLGLFAALDGIPLADLVGTTPDLAAARARYPAIAVPDTIRDDLVATAAALGIATLRAPRFAMAAARAAAALAGRAEVTADDARIGAELCLAHRGAPPPEEQARDRAPPDDAPPPDPQDGDGTAADADRLVEAARTALPPGLLAGLAAARAARGPAASGAGDRTRGTSRGRPLPARPGRPDRGRIDAAATLRAAAPWQPMRRRAAPDDPRRLLLRPADIHLKRTERRTERLVIFAVDASGSAAMSRMAEAKGAIESLLSQSYAARDRVALIAFRRETAEILLPPTRSLTQSRKRLQALPGGGGTPLAAALATAGDLATRARRDGLSPSLVLLTDGRANIALDGTANRARAAEDATRLARSLGLPALVIDTGTRPNPALRALAGALDAPLVSLPRSGIEAALSEMPR